MSPSGPDPLEPGSPHPTQPEANEAGIAPYFIALIEGIPPLVWTSNDSGEWTWASPSWTAYTGQTSEASQSFGWCMAVHPDDRAAMAAAWRQADAGGVLDVEHRLLDPARPGEARWFHTHATPLPDAPRQEKRWLGVCADLHETRLLRERERLLLEAFQHRVDGVLALTRAIARQTARSSGTVEDYALHLDSRLDAIALTQAIMARNPQASVDLEHLVTDGLLAHAAHQGEQVHISGPSVRLTGKAAELFGLAIHELAMNAVEHGALAMPQRDISATWSVEQAGTGGILRFEWVETGAPAMTTRPRRNGFGTELIERILEQELGATGSLEFGRDGVRCTIALPLSAEFAALDPRPPG